MTQSKTSPFRVAGTLLAAAVAFVGGFYGGIFVLLSLVGLGDFEGWQFELATVPAGTVAAGLAAALAAPRTRSVISPVLATAIVTAAVATAALLLIDGDFAVAIILGGVAAVTATVAAAFVSDRRTRGV